MNGETPTEAAETGSAPARLAPRTRKFRQAAFVYLHVGLLYEFVVFILWRDGLLPETRGSGPLWLGIGAAITAFVFWGLWRWRNPHFAKAIWLLHALRLPALIRGAFFSDASAILPANLYLIAIPVVLVNLWMLARAGWDL